MLKEKSDKRKLDRQDCLVPVDGKTGTLFSKTRTVDISRDGIGFLSDHPVPLNEKIAIELALKPDSEPVLVIGEVRWVRKLSDSEQYRIGLVFADVVDGTRDDIEATLHTRGTVRPQI